MKTTTNKGTNVGLKAKKRPSFMDVPLHNLAILIISSSNWSKDTYCFIKRYSKNTVEVTLFKNSISGKLWSKRLKTRIAFFHSILRELDWHFWEHFLINHLFITQINFCWEYNIEIIALDPRMFILVHRLLLTRAASKRSNLFSYILFMYSLDLEIIKQIWNTPTENKTKSTMIRPAIWFKHLL